MRATSTYVSFVRRTFSLLEPTLKSKDKAVPYSAYEASSRGHQLVLDMRRFAVRIKPTGRPARVYSPEELSIMLHTASLAVVHSRNWVN